MSSPLYLREHLPALLNLSRLHPGLYHQRLVEALVKVGVDIILPHLCRRWQPEAEQGRLRRGQPVGEAGRFGDCRRFSISVVLLLQVAGSVLLRLQVSIVVITVHTVGAVRPQPKFCGRVLCQKIWVFCENKGNSFLVSWRIISLCLCPSFFAQRLSLILSWFQKCFTWSQKGKLRQKSTKSI